MADLKNVFECSGGVCAPIGFMSSGVHCGIRKNKNKKDLALIVSDVPCVAAGVYTQNLVKGAPVVVTKRHLENGKAQAIICNSGNANTCNADGIEVAEDMCSIVESTCGIPADDVIVASTGVIGQRLDLTPIASAADVLCAGLGDNSHDAADAIMTTDRVSKEISVRFMVGSVECRIGAIAKGVGMVCPNMATNLIFITTDTYISHEMLDRSLRENVDDTFNMVSVDGDQSTNDMCCILANGMAGNDLISGPGDGYDAFSSALFYCMEKLSRMIAKDGEGATKLLTCRVFGAESVRSAKAVAKSVIKSSLVKAAMFGADANWGRVLCAVGYSGEKIDPDKIDVVFSSSSGEIRVCEDGRGVDFSEEIAKKILSEDEICIDVGLNVGTAEAKAWGCDLTYDYVKINGDYRT